jgi:hypothetical protein
MNLFRNWLNGVEKQTTQICVGLCALVWVIWTCRNDLFFNKKKGTSHFLQVIRMATHWTRDWSYLLPKAQRVPIDIGCSRLETAARHYLQQDVWRFSKRVQHY